MDPYEHRFGGGNRGALSYGFGVRNIAIHSPYYFKGSYHYVYYENGQIDHFYSSMQITEGKLKILKWSFRIGVVGFSFLFLSLTIIMLILGFSGSGGFNPAVLIFLIPVIILAPVCAVMLSFFRKRYKIDMKAFYLPDAERVYQQTTCQYCGGVIVYGMHNECPHCGNVLPPTWGPIYVI